MTVRVEMLEGRRHYVVPVVMIRAGTWAGSQGPTYYPSHVLNESAARWNGRPVVVYHPEMFGKFVSALDPYVFDRQRVGTLFNASFDGDKLRAEAWIDAERVGQADYRIRDAIQAGQAMNVSTGMFADTADRPGADSYGQPVQTAVRLHPDHLAILPDGEGACSVQDGAGLFCNVYAAAGWAVAY